MNISSYLSSLEWIDTDNPNIGYALVDFEEALIYFGKLSGSLEVDGRIYSLEQSDSFYLKVVSY